MLTCNDKRWHLHLLQSCRDAHALIFHIHMSQRIGGHPLEVLAELREILLRNHCTHIQASIPVSPLKWTHKQLKDRRITPWTQPPQTGYWTQQGAADYRMIDDLRRTTQQLHQDLCPQRKTDHMRSPSMSPFSDQLRNPLGSIRHAKRLE